jgi:hypothetical protein
MAKVIVGSFIVSISPSTVQLCFRVKTCDDGGGKGINIPPPVEFMGEIMTMAKEDQSQPVDHQTGAEDTETLQYVSRQVKGQTQQTKDRLHPEPTRYGDWEKNGRCIDF